MLIHGYVITIRSAVKCTLCTYLCVMATGRSTARVTFEIIVDRFTIRPRINDEICVVHSNPLAKEDIFTNGGEGGRTVIITVFKLTP